MFILDWKEFVKNNKWVLQTVIGATDFSFMALAKWNAWELSVLVDEYSYVSAMWASLEKCP